MHQKANYFFNAVHQRELEAPFDSFNITLLLHSNVSWESLKLVESSWMFSFSQGHVTPPPHRPMSSNFPWCQVCQRVFVGKEHDGVNLLNMTLRAHTQCLKQPPALSQKNDSSPDQICPLTGFDLLTEIMSWLLSSLLGQTWKLFSKMFARYKYDLCLSQF